MSQFKQCFSIKLSWFIPSIKQMFTSIIQWPLCVYALVNKPICHQSVCITKIMCEYGMNEIAKQSNEWDAKSRKMQNKPSSYVVHSIDLVSLHWLYLHLQSTIKQVIFALAFSQFVRFNGYKVSVRFSQDRTRLYVFCRSTMEVVEKW